MNNKNKVLALLANVSNALSPLIVLLSISHTLGVEKLGVYGFIQALSLPISLFFSMKIRSYVVGIGDDVERLSNARILVEINAVFCFVVLSAAVFAFSPKGISNLAIWALSLSYSIAVCWEYSMGALQSKGRWADISRSSLVYGLVPSVMFFLMLLSELGFSESLIVYALLRVLIGFSSYWLIRRSSFEWHSTVSFQRRVLARYSEEFLTVVPLGLVAVLGALYLTFPRVILGTQVGVYEVGVFTGTLTALFAFNLLVSTQNQIANTRFSSSDKSEKQLVIILKSCVAGIWKAGALYSIVVLIFVDVFSALIFGEMIVSRSMMLLALGSGFFNAISSIVGVAMVVLKRQYLYLKLTLIVVSFSLPVSYFLVNGYSTTGAFFAYFLTSMVLAVLSIILFDYVAKRQPKRTI